MSAQQPIRILVVDDHEMVRIGMKTIIDQQPDLSVVGEAPDAQTALELFRRLRPDVLLMDLRLPGTSGIEATASLLSEFPQARVLVVSNWDGDEDIYQALRAGAAGYLFKSTLRGELLDAIRSVHAGHQYLPKNVSLRLDERSEARGLTRREKDILEMVGKGCSYKELAQILGVSTETIKTHLGNIFRKLDVSDRAEAMREAIYRGFLHLD